MKVTETTFLQIQGEYEGVKKFRLDPSKEKESEPNGVKPAEAAVSKSTTAKLLEEIAAKKSEKYVLTNA